MTKINPTYLYNYATITNALAKEGYKPVSSAPIRSIWSNGEGKIGLYFLNGSCSLVNFNKKNVLNRMAVNRVEPLLSRAREADIELDMSIKDIFSNAEAVLKQIDERDNPSQ